VCMMRRKQRSAAAWVVMATVAALSGCATKSDLRDLEDEIHALAARQDSVLTELRRETMSTQDTIRTQTDQIFDFRGEITRQLQLIQQSQTRLEAIAGENQRGIATLRGQAVSGRPPTTGGGLQLADSAGRPSGNETVAGTGGNAAQLWAVARDQHQRGSLSTAQRAYEQFLKENPNDPLAPDAHFYLADILSQQNRPEDALEAFQEIQRLYPTSDKVPDSLYRIAVLQHQMGKNDDAKATCQRIINTYPDATSALLARDLLAEIG
jgi:tol-pal system protein YbgF